MQSHCKCDRPLTVHLCPLVAFFCLFVLTKEFGTDRYTDLLKASSVCLPHPAPYPVSTPLLTRDHVTERHWMRGRENLGCTPPPSTSLLESQASRLQGPLGQPEKVVPRLVTSLPPRGPDGGKEIAGSRVGQVCSQRLHGNWACLRGLGGVGGLNLAPRAHP